MSSNSNYQRIQNFIGSKEEAIAIRYLRLITFEAYLPPHGMCGFYNLIINTCNADQGTCFTDAMVNLQLIDECRKAIREHYECGFPKCGFVFLKDIMDESILKLFVTGGVRSIEKFTDYQQAFLALLQFLHDKGRHEQSIKSIITNNSAPGSKETDITVAMAHHLFSQLVPGNRYEVDDHVKDIPRECGCGCQGRISQGDTSLGSQDTWHGRVDILLGDTIAVCVKEDDSSDEMTEDDTSSDDEDDESDEDSVEPVTKQRKLSYSDCHTKVKPTKTDVLLDQNTLNQIFAEAVTNSFAQVNMNKDKFSDLLIPTFGSTCYNVSICLYDPINDYLMHIKSELPLWCPGDETIGRLDTTTVVIVWLFVNFTLFTKKKLHALLDLDKSGLHTELKEHLQFYRKTETKRSCVSPTSVPQLWKYVQPSPRLLKE